MLHTHYNQLHVLLQMHLKPSQLTNAGQSSAGAGRKGGAERERGGGEGEREYCEGKVKRTAKAITIIACEQLLAG